MRRINLFGGPGCGKSVVASMLYHRLSVLNFSVSFVSEYIKNWAYEKRQASSYDQIYIFAKQLRSEDLLLRNNVKYIITDSPLLMQVPYAVKYGFECIDELISICKNFEAKYPSVNIVLNRENIPYEHCGRYENYQEAQEMDFAIKNILSLNDIDFIEVPSVGHEKIFDLVVSKL